MQWHAYQEMIELGMFQTDIHEELRSPMYTINYYWVVFYIVVPLK